MPDLNQTFSRLSRQVARLGRTPRDRAVLLAAGAVLAFVVGRLTADGPTSPGHTTEIPASVSGTPLVLDGDTLDFNGLRVRLFGIDAFERDQLCARADGSRYGCGQVARETLMVAIARAPVTCVRRDVDQYGRMVAVCRTRDDDLAARVVAEGSALAYRKYSNDYVDEEDVARQAKRGVWSGSFEAPWDYRRSGERKDVR